MTKTYEHVQGVVQNWWKFPYVVGPKLVNIPVCCNLCTTPKLLRKTHSWGGGLAVETILQCQSFLIHAYDTLLNTEGFVSVGISRHFWYEIFEFVIHVCLSDTVLIIAWISDKLMLMITTTLLVQKLLVKKQNMTLMTYYTLFYILYYSIQSCPSLYFNHQEDTINGKSTSRLISKNLPNYR